MKGIVLASHGPMAKGLYETSCWFFGQDQQQIKYLCLEEGASPDQFVEDIAAACNEVDSGDGVLLFCDLLFGSPCNCAMRALRDGVDVITGMNLSMLLEVLGSREFESFDDISHIIDVGHEGIKDLRKVLEEMDNQ